ncbi:MAG: hypothetical protein GY754_30985 [bacterium]|nr:hypothetical protein [bacterium]
MTKKNIHLVGVCGIAMGTLAGMLKEQGHSLSGSDENVYPPMSDILRKSGIIINKGYSEENIKDATLVIIGNAISRGNPEVEYVLDNNIPYMSMAGALYAFFLRDKEVISISGTHGKSTTTALLAHILESAGESPSFLVGAVANNFNSNYKLGKGKYFVIEGDEYDSAFFEKVPKFIFYRPHHLVLTSLEFDHADIFSNLEEIELWFKRLITLIPSKGNIVYSAAYGNLEKLASRSFSRTFSFGNGEVKPHFGYRFLGFDNERALLAVDCRSGESPEENETLELSTTLFGEFNYANIAAAVSMARLLGIKKDLVVAGVASFKGIKRRQEVIYKRDNCIIYEDFAHHPTAIAFMLTTVKERFPGSRVWAIYEPRSATSRRNIFQDALPAAFDPAHRTIIKTPYRLDSIPEEDRLNIERVVETIRTRGGDPSLFAHVDEIVSRVKETIDPGVKNVIIIMSNGGFDGIYKTLPLALDEVFE